MGIIVILVRYSVRKMRLMNLENNLFNARKKRGLSQEEVAAKLGISRQIISKWELGETIPDIYQSKRLSILYHLSLALLYFS